ncbi:hypothetical protein ACE6H2_020658 [Prunus campanulata]
MLLSTVLKSILELHTTSIKLVGPKILRQNRSELFSISRKLLSSKGVVTQHGNRSDNGIEIKIVYRHLRDGDIVLVNRQDHVISAVLLTKKDTFLRWDEFNQLLYNSCGSARLSDDFSGKPGEYKSDKDGQQKEKKPNKEQATDKEKSKEKEEHDENHLLIYRNNLVRGVIDKAQFGDYGLVHTVQEFYGSDTAGKLLSVLSHLFTSYLQMHGFTCGVDDLLLLESEDSKMMDQRESCEDVGEKVYSDFIKFKDVKRNDPVELQLNIEKFIRSNAESALASLDRRMISELNNKTTFSDVFKQLLLRALSKPSVKNCIHLMTTSGAEGSVRVCRMRCRTGILFFVLYLGMYRPLCLFHESGNSAIDRDSNAADNECGR